MTNQYGVSQEDNDRLLELMGDEGWTPIRTDIGSVTIRRADGRMEHYPDAAFVQKRKGERVKTEFTVKAEALGSGDTLILDRHPIDVTPEFTLLVAPSSDEPAETTEFGTLKEG